VTAPAERGPVSTGWRSGRWPPLIGLVLLTFLVLFVLPSSLNLPQTNPTETAEFAPVPPSDDDLPPPDVGNVASLGLAGSESLAGEIPPSTLPPPPNDDGPPPLAPGPAAVSRSPSSKRCVGNPPKQTEDPVSPPCVAYFDPAADNGGATYPGVTREEVRVLWYIDGGGQYLTSTGFQPAPVDTYQDLGQEAGEDEFVYTRALRGWQRYFNERFQTYGRFVHFYIYWSGADVSPEARRADAADNYNKIKPFAILSQARDNQDAYLEAMAQRGVMNFGSIAGRDEGFYRKYPKLIWGYFPSIQQQASQFSSYVCKKVVPFPVSFSGNPEQIGQPRRLGLLSTSDPQRAGYGTFAALVKKDVEACGGKFVAARTFPGAGSDNAANNPPDVMAQNIAEFRQQGVTTIIWPQGQETGHSGVAESANYLPEWVVAGDLTMEGNLNGQRQTGQRAWDHAVAVTNLTRLEVATQQQCYVAYKETDPDMPDSPDITLHACNLYRDPFQLFVAIQVAGPKLRPDAIDQGFRAIPKIASTDPHVPACYYEPGDYTCVKDAMVERWDRTGTSSSANTAGCYRMLEGGRRYRAGTWPDGDVIAQRSDGDVCNNFAGDTHG
jgi:hypothetical protein